MDGHQDHEGSRRMKNMIAVLLAVGLSACAAGPTYEAAQQSEFTQANYAAIDKLLATTAQPIDRNAPLLIATLVDIDSLNQSSRFGRLISEQIATRLTQQGFNVVEMKLRDNVYIREGAGELFLSRDVRNLSKSYQAQVVVVGNYAVAAEYVYLTLKVVMAADNRVISAVNYVLPITLNSHTMLKSSANR